MTNKLPKVDWQEQIMQKHAFSGKFGEDGASLQNTPQSAINEEHNSVSANNAHTDNVEDNCNKVKQNNSCFSLSPESKITDEVEEAKEDLKSELKDWYDSFGDFFLKKPECNHSWAGKRIGDTCEDCDDKFFSKVRPFCQNGVYFTFKKAQALLDALDKQHMSKLEPEIDIKKENVDPVNIKTEAKPVPDNKIEGLPWKEIGELKFFNQPAFCKIDNKIVYGWVNVNNLHGSFLKATDSLNQDKIDLSEQPAQIFTMNDLITTIESILERINKLEQKQ